MQLRSLLSITEVFNMPIILSKITSWFSKLSAKEAIILLLVLSVVGLLFSTNSYRNEAIQLQTALDTKKTVEEIERDNIKLENYAKETERLRSKMEKKNDTITYLFTELDRIKSKPNTRTQVMEELGDLNNTQDICRALTKRGYDICGDYDIPSGR